MSDSTKLNITRLRVGLLAFVLAVFVDFVDVPLEDFDVLHDGAALALYAAAAWGIGQRATGTFVPFFWIPVAACAFAILFESIDANWTYGFFERLGAFLFSALGLMLFALGMLRMTKNTGIASSSRWRRAMLEIGLLIVLPGIVIGFLTEADPRPELPFRHAPGSIDERWWTHILAWGSVLAAGLALFDTSVAALTTWRSAGRREAD